MNLRMTAIEITVLSFALAVSIAGNARAAQVTELEKLNVCYSSIAATSMV